MHNDIYSITAYQITLALNLTKGNEWPNWISPNVHTIQQEVLLNDFSKNQLVDFQINSIDENICFVNSNQLTIDTKQSITITDIWVNGIKLDIYLLIPYFSFKPNYTVKDKIIAKQQKKDLIEMFVDFFQPIKYNGTWQFSFKQPFFIWYRNLSTVFAESLSQDKQSDIFGQITREQISRVKYLIEQFS
jgi:hypothetical protein